MSRVGVNRPKMLGDLTDHPEILSEAYQTVMRLNGVDNSYDKMKDAFRGKPATADSQIIDIEPHEYIGLAEKLCDMCLDKWPQA